MIIPYFYTCFFSVSHSKNKPLARPRYVKAFPPSQEHKSGCKNQYFNCKMVNIKWIVAPNPVIHISINNSFKHFHHYVQLNWFFNKPLLWLVFNLPDLIFFSLQSGDVLTILPKGGRENMCERKERGKMKDGETESNWKTLQRKKANKRWQREWWTGRIPLDIHVLRCRERKTGIIINISS